MNFAANLKAFRIKAGLSQEQLAHACGYSGQSRIGNYESSAPNARQPKPNEIPKIAKALGVSVGELFGEAPPSHNSQPVRLDPEIVAKVARALRATYAPEGLVYSFYDEHQLFVDLYEDAANGRLSATGGAVKIGRWIERTSPQGAENGRLDGVPATGTDKGKKGVHRKA